MGTRFEAEISNNIHILFPTGNKFWIALRVGWAGGHVRCSDAMYSEFILSGVVTYGKCVGWESKYGLGCARNVGLRSGEVHGDAGGWLCLWSVVRCLLITMFSLFFCLKSGRSRTPPVVQVHWMRWASYQLVMFREIRNDR